MFVPTLPGNANGLQDGAANYLHLGQLRSVAYVAWAPHHVASGHARGGAGRVACTRMLLRVCPTAFYSLACMRAMVINFPTALAVFAAVAAPMHTPHHPLNGCQFATAALRTLCPTNLNGRQHLGVLCTCNMRARRHTSLCVAPPVQGGNEHGKEPLGGEGGAPVALGKCQRWRTSNVVSWYYTKRPHQGQIRHENRCGRRHTRTNAQCQQHAHALRNARMWLRLRVNRGRSAPHSHLRTRNTGTALPAFSRCRTRRASTHTTATVPREPRAAPPTLRSWRNRATPATCAKASGFTTSKPRRSRPGPTPAREPSCA